MSSPSLVCGINVWLVQLQDMHDMQENVRQSNLQLVSFIQERVLLSLNWIYYFRTGQDIYKIINVRTCELKGHCWHDVWVTPQMV